MYLNLHAVECHYHSKECVFGPSSLTVDFVENQSEPPEYVELMVIELWVVIDTQPIDWHSMIMSFVL